MGKARGRGAVDKERKFSSFANTKSPALRTHKHIVRHGDLGPAGRLWEQKLHTIQLSALKLSLQSQLRPGAAEREGQGPGPAPWSNVNSSILSEQIGTCCLLGPLLLFLIN